MNNEEIKQMRSLLINLSKTKYWPAIQWFSNVSRINIDNANRSIDPVANPTDIARNQGMWWGVKELERYINEELEAIKEKEKEAVENAQAEKN